MAVDGCRACALGEETACNADNQDEADALFTCMKYACPNDCLAPDPVCSNVPEAPPSGGSCVTVYGIIACNPVTGEPCDTAAGQACDRVGTQSFACVPGDNTKALCEVCGASDGYCENGMACTGVSGTTNQGSCAKFCCTDEDCGPDGICDTTTYSFGPIPELGMCFEK
jgi:hypothetical protein